MTRQRRPWKRVEPSQELLSWIEDEILDTIRKKQGQAFWTHIYARMNSSTDNVEWNALTDYGRNKTLNSVLEQLSERKILFREKSYRPYVMLNPLDLIVEAIDRDEQSAQSTD